MLLLKFITPGCANCGWIIQKTLPWVMLGESFNGPVISCHTAGSETNSPAAQYHGLRNRLYWGQEKLMKTWSSKKMGGTPPPLPCHLLTIPGCFAGTVYVPVLSHLPFSFMMVQVLMQLCYWGINRDRSKGTLNDVLLTNQHFKRETQVQTGFVFNNARASST